MRRMSPFTMFLILESLGLELVVRENTELLERVKSRLTKRLKPRVIRAGCTKTISFHLMPDFMKQIQRKGGYARAQSMTPAQRSQSARKAVQARWEKHRAAQAIAN
jgi:hypothetical protein